MSLLSYSLAKCGKDIVIEDRNTTIINGLPAVIFSNPIDGKAIFKAVSGVSVFDSTNTETIATHRVAMAYNAAVTAEKWIKLGAKRYRILTTTNCGEQDDDLILMCTERGTEASIVNTG